MRARRAAPHCLAVCREIAWNKYSKLATQTKQAAPWTTRASILDSESISNQKKSMGIWSADVLGNDAACEALRDLLDIAGCDVPPFGCAVTTMNDRSGGRD